MKNNGKKPINTGTSENEPKNETGAQNLYRTKRDGRVIRTRRSKWTDGTIRNAIERFIEEYGRPPKIKELDKYDWLPTHSSISNRFDMNPGDWMIENYPSDSISWKCRFKSFTKEDYMTLFISEYTRLMPESKLAYNANRTHNTPSWEYIAKVLGVNTWNELKELCGVNFLTKRKGSKSFSVISHIVDTEESDDMFSSEVKHYTHKKRGGNPRK